MLVDVAPAARADLDAVHALQAAAYPAALLEPKALFADILERGRSLVARLPGPDPAVVGYLLAHGTPAGRVPLLHEALPPAGAGDELFIHDLTVAPAHRSRGVGGALVARLLDGARRPCSLVAVNGAEGFWARRGFRAAAAASEEEAAALRRSYGGPCTVMRRA